MVKINNIPLFLLLLFFQLNLIAENEIGFALGIQKPNVERYGIDSRNLGTAYYKYTKGRNSLWLEINHSIANVRVILPAGTFGGPGPIKLKQFSLNTKITCVSASYGLHIIEKKENQLSIGAGTGLCFLHDGYNVTNTRIHFTSFMQFTKKKIFFDKIGIHARLENTFLGKAPGIEDASPAFLKMNRLFSLSIGINYSF